MRWQGWIWGTIVRNFEEINGNMREEQGIQMRWDDNTKDIK